jgi:hypothetical protein
MNPAFIPAIEVVEAKVEALTADLLLQKRLVNQLYEAAGEQPKYPEEQLSVGSKAGAPILGDQFTGKPLATCVKWILERRKASIARRNVAITLGKNPAFMKVPSSGDIGLAEWYPGLKRKSAPRTDEEAIDQGLDEAAGENLPV